MKIDYWKIRGWNVTGVWMDRTAMKPRAKKTDKRFTGREYFGYYVNLASKTTEPNFHDVRAWCWEQWGPSKELSDWLKDRRFGAAAGPCQNPHWCWSNDEYRRRIMFHSQEEAAMFTLTFGM